MLNSILHKSIITFSFTCVFANFLGAQWVQKGVDIDGEFEQERLGAAMAMNADGNIVAVGGIGGSFGPTAALRTRVFEWSGSSWQQKGSSLTSHSTDVSLNDEGNRLAVGFDLEGEGWTFGEGVVRIFEWDGSDWIIMGDSLKGDDDDDDFGYNVELNMEGDVVVVGARNSGSGPTAPGYVKVFEWDGSSWLQKGSKIIGEAAWDEFGYRVSINDSGNVIAVGGRHNDEVANYAGHARVFQWDGSDWIQRGEDIDGEFEYDQFGSGIALDGSGNTVAIGANNSDFGSTMNCGQVRIFDWDGESWNQRGETIYGPGYQALAGSAIDMSRDGNFVAVGAHWYLSETGMVQVFMWYDNAWVQVGSDLVGEAVDDRSGHRVQLSESGYVVASSALDISIAWRTISVRIVFLITHLKPTPLCWVFVCTLKGRLILCSNSLTILFILSLDSFLGL